MNQSQDRLVEVMQKDRSLAVFTQAVTDSFSFLKQARRMDELYARSLPLEQEQGYLLPVCELHASDEALVATLARWREENAFAYPSQFPVTIASTASWLKAKLLEVPDRLLFLVVDRFGTPIGHLGFANALNDERELEIDNVVRGVKDGAKGLMSNAMRTLINWAEEAFSPKAIYLRVFQDNPHAVEFYRNLGFQDDRVIPLRRHDNANGFTYLPVADGDTAEPDKSFLRMVYSPRREWNGSRMILTAGPSISARETSYALDAVRHGWNNHWGDYIKRFEAEFAAYLGVKYALCTSSCTGALHLALAALGIGPGDEVIVPDITWVATANAVTYVGATPVFADIQPDSWCLDPDSFESLITERTKAVIPVHLYGHPAQMDRIMEIAQAHRLHVVEDSAPAIGAEFQGQKTGTFGDFAAFSFQGAKLLVTGEGGMLVTNSDELYARVKSLWDQGRDPNRTFWIHQIGWKYKMSNLQAALGLGQLERVDELIEAKRRIFAWYEAGLEGIPGIALNRETPWARSIYWMPSIVVDEQAGISRDDLQVALKRRNIDTRPVFPAISQYPIWGYTPATQPTAQRIGNQAINLPSGVLLKREQIDYVCRNLREILSEVRNDAVRH